MTAIAGSRATVTLDPDNNWRLAAACRGKDPALWQLDSTLDAIQAGETICQRHCWVKAPCLVEALNNGDTGVIRGGQRLSRDNALSNGPLRRCRQCGGPFRGRPDRQYCGHRCQGAARTAAAAERKTAVAA